MKPTSPNEQPRRLWARTALLPGGWAEDVSIGISDSGDITEVRAGAGQSGHTPLRGAIIAGIPNVHSHAHQRAMAGLGERAGPGGDSFWTWREVMYRYLQRIGPQQLYRIARQLYLEMLKSGYTSVAEFQYLHHDIHGRPYADRAEMTLQCLQAARDTGIGFTALPVLYAYGGFGAKPPDEGQKRFINDARQFCEISERLISATRDDANSAAGIAPHSLRAVSQELLAETLRGLHGSKLAAIHIHIAEQTREVEECAEWSGLRPVEWLYRHCDVDQHWCLVHATHMTEEETTLVAASGAIAGLCPTTEANLGDGFFNAAGYRAAGGRWAIGSDSHISISPVEEMRWLEYADRLNSRARNRYATATVPSTGRALLDASLDGGARACGRRIGLIEAGYRADLVVLDAEHPRLYGRSGDALLDSWIFSGNTNLVRDVYVGGEQVIDNGRHPDERRIGREYRQTLDELTAS